MVPNTQLARHHPFPTPTPCPFIVAPDRASQFHGDASSLPVIISAYRVQPEAQSCVYNQPLGHTRWPSEKPLLQRSSHVYEAFIYIYVGGVYATPHPNPSTYMSNPVRISIYSYNGSILM